MPSMVPRPLVAEWLRRHVLPATAVLCIAVAAWLAGSAWRGVPAHDDMVDTGTFAHWYGHGHDWLLQAEPSQGLLVIYDANDGRPLRRLHVAGLQRIVLEDDWLFVLGPSPAGVRLLRLPALAWRDGSRPDTRSP